MTLDEANDASVAGFVSAFGAIYEDSPWVAERAAAARPFASVDALHAAMAGAVAEASDAERRALVAAHPDLGTRLKLGPSSAAEQAGLGLDRLSAEEFARFDGLNRAYRARFGFPFVIAVRRQTRESVLAAFEARLANEPAAELRAALAEIDAIARLRLDSLPWT
jgi:2-oxo-4-hydroxy-4-carboxy-5-ureidoimidazoline decarboxylase